MSTEENKNILRRYLEEAWQKGNETVLRETVDPNLIDHAPLPNLPQGLEGQRRAIQLIHSAFKNIQINIDSLVAEGDRAADHWVFTGVHKGDFMGIPATGKSVTITGSDVVRFAGGKIAEVWHVEDYLGLMQQLGVMPAATGTAPGKTASTTPPRRSGDAKRPGTPPSV